MGVCFSQSQWQNGECGYCAGLVQKIGIGEGIPSGKSINTINHTEGIIALDGERELPVRLGENWMFCWIKMVR
jgi:hypothetical protein